MRHPRSLWAARLITFCILQELAVMLDNAGNPYPKHYRAMRDVVSEAEEHARNTKRAPPVIQMCFGGAHADGDGGGLTLLRWVDHCLCGVIVVTSFSICTGLCPQA